MNSEYSVIVADGQPLVREGFKSLLRNFPEYRILGEATDARSAVILAKETRPDIVVLDLCLSAGGGVNCIQEIHRVSPKTKTIVLGDRSGEEHVLASLDAGASGYVLKEDPVSELLSALAGVVRGETYLSSSTAHHLATDYLSTRLSDKIPNALEELTSREREVFHLVGAGKKNREVAEHLFISIKTVEKHRANIMRKLKFKSAADLRNMWQRLGFGG